MAGSVQNDDGEITGINVTPLVDVMLVLLIIFMVTATYIVKQSIQIQLPKAASGGETTKKTLSLAITKDGKTYLDGQYVTDDVLVQKLDAMKDKNNLQAMIGADKDSLHGVFVHVVDLLKTHGISNFAIQIEKDEGP